MFSGWRARQNPSYTALHPVWILDPDKATNIDAHVCKTIDIKSPEPPQQLWDFHPDWEAPCRKGEDYMCLSMFLSTWVSKVFFSKVVDRRPVFGQSQDPLFPCNLRSSGSNVFRLDKGSTNHIHFPFAVWNVMGIENAFQHKLPCRVFSAFSSKDPETICLQLRKAKIRSLPEYTRKTNSNWGIESILRWVLFQNPSCVVPRLVSLMVGFHIGRSVRMFSEWRKLVSTQSVFILDKEDFSTWFPTYVGKYSERQQMNLVLYNKNVENILGEQSQCTKSKKGRKKHS